LALITVAVGGDRGGADPQVTDGNVWFEAPWPRGNIGVGSTVLMPVCSASSGGWR
jgi:hypothetical protein